MKNETLAKIFATGIPVPLNEWGDDLFNIYFSEEYYGYTRERYDDDKWDNGDRAYGQSLNQIVETDPIIFKHLGKDDLVVAYVLWAQYSTGDTFGHSAGACTAALAISLNADNKLDEIELAYQTPKKSNQTVLSGPTFPEWATHFTTTYIPWAGYFESLDHMLIEKVILTKKNK